MSWLSSFLLHPGLVWFLPLAAVPLILHLLMLHRLKTVELSTYRFLFDSYVQQRRRMRFLEALLAMLRTAFLLFLVLVFCRPVVKHWNDLFKVGTGREVVMLIDSSASMAARTAGVSAFDRAKAAALSVLERLTPQDKLTLVRVTARPEEVFSQYATDPEAARSRIDELKTSPARANLFAALMGLFGPEAERRPNMVVYLFTDCQATGWREVRNQGLDRYLPAEADLVVVNVGSSKPLPNLAVIGDAPRRTRAVVGLPVFLSARVVNYAREPVEPTEVTIKVFIDEKEVTRHNLTLKPGETAVHKIKYYPSEPGVHRGRFEISGKTPDQFPDDDNYLFTLQVVPQLQVVLVNGNPSASPTDSECFFLNHALSAQREPTPEEKKAEEKRLAAMGLAKDFFRALDVREVQEVQLNAEVLRDASVVVLANCGGLNPNQFVWLREFTAAGGGLLIFPGDRVNPTVYNTQFFKLPSAPQEPALTPATLGAPQGDPDRAETFERLAAIDFTHPILTAFDVPNGKFFEAVFFQRRFPLSLPEQKQEDLWPLARFTKGEPALVESRFGDGIVLLAAFPANTKWTNLPARGGHAFVPLILRAVSYAQHRPEVEGPAVVSPGASAEIAVTKNWPQAVVKVTDPAGRVSTLELERAGSRFAGVYEGTLEKGYYTVEVNSGRSEQARGSTVAFAVNLAPEESDFSTLDEDKLRELLPSAHLTVVDASAEAQQEHRLTDNGREVWRWLIWILFPIILVEFLLATLGGQRKEGEEAPTVAERIRQLSPGSWVGRMTGST